MIKLKIKIDIHELMNNIRTYLNMLRGRTATLLYLHSFVNNDAFFTSSIESAIVVPLTSQ